MANVVRKSNRFRRPCVRCEKMFRPDGKFQKVCLKCTKQKSMIRLIKAYNMLEK